jgi:hypothetical protein
MPVSLIEALIEEKQRQIAAMDSDLEYLIELWQRFSLAYWFDTVGKNLYGRRACS